MFPVNFKPIDPYQHIYIILMVELKCSKYETDDFCGFRNTIQLVTYKDKMAITQKPQIYIVHWYHNYLLCPVLY